MEKNRLFVLIALVVVFGCSKKEQNAGNVLAPVVTANQGDQKVQVVALQQPMSLPDILNSAARNGFTATELRLEVGDITIGFQPGNRSVLDAERDFYNSLAEFVEFKTTRNAATGAGSRSIESLRSQLTDRSTKFQFVQVTTANPTQVAQILNGQLREDIPASGVHPPLIDGRASPDAAVSNPSPSPTSSNHEWWAPYTGWASVNKSYTYNEFRFNNTSFGSNQCYEHETNIYNPTYANYAGFWGSNLPMGYYDSYDWFANSGHWDTFAVGTLQANALSRYYTYWTYVKLYAQPVSSPTSKVTINGQLAHRACSWCYSAAFVVIDATTLPNMGGSFYAPGVLNYTY